MPVEKSLNEQLWKNMLIIRSSKDRQYVVDVLEARKAFLNLRRRHELAIRKVYLDAADNVAKELRRLKPTIGDLTRSHLTALEKSLRREAERIQQTVETLVKDGMVQAVSFGGKPLDNHLVRALRKAPVPLDFLKLQQGFGDINSAAVESLWARTQNGLRVSDRIWKQSRRTRGALRDIIQAGMAQGRDAVKVARDIEKYVRDGAKTLAGDYPNMMARMGNRVPKNLNYEALRLVRTEYTKAYTEGVYSRGRTNPSYQGVRWMLSDAHPVPDVCFIGGTLITTREGPKPIEAIQVGDVVLTHAGQWRPVTKLYQRTIQQGALIQLHYQGAQNRIHRLVLTPNHPVLTVQGWQRASELQKGSLGLSFVLDSDETLCRPRCDEVRTALSSFGESGPSESVQTCFGGLCDVLCQAVHIRRIEGRDLPLPICSPMFENDTYQRQSFLQPNGDCWSLSALPTACGECRGGVDNVLNNDYHSSGWLSHDVADIVENNISEVDRQQILFRMFGKSVAGRHGLRGSIPWSKNGEWFHLLWQENEFRTRDIFSQFGLNGFGRHIFDYRNALSQNDWDGHYKMGQEQFLSRNVRSASYGPSPLSYVQNNMRTGVVQAVLLKDKKWFMAKNIRVYNLGVAEDNSYFANGIAVHNCDDYAEADLYDLGSGIYPQGEEPVNPHPNCLCYPLPVLLDTEELVQNLIEWRNDPSSQPELESWYNEVYLGGIGASAIPVSTVSLLEKVLKEKEDEIVNRSTEMGYAFDPDGNIILSKVGDRSSISFTSQEMEKMRGSVFTHNHPRGSSFSPADISIAARYELKEIRAVGQEYAYSMSPTSSWPDWGSEIQGALRKRDAEVRNEFWAAINSGKMTIDQAERLHYHEVWTRVSEDLPELDYRRVRR